jgi:DNA gyrase subunit B
MEAQGAVATVFGDAFAAFLEENPDQAKSIINKAILAVRARKAAKAAKDSILRKGALEGMTLPGKLADCQSKSAEESELFIVEGDSAGGTAKTGRDRRTQAILPLRGKILNIERARLDRMLASEQIKNLVVALGTAIGDTFDISKLRYHKVIIATDADVDGAHIRTLILTLLYYGTLSRCLMVDLFTSLSHHFIKSKKERKSSIHIPMKKKQLSWVRKKTLTSMK